MQGISTTIELVDQMTAPIMAISNALNNLVSGFTDVAAASNVDTSSLEAMKRQIELANTAANTLSQTNDSIKASLENLPEVVPVKIEPIWETQNNLNLFDNTGWVKPQTVDVIIGDGINRYKQEIQSANIMMDNVIRTQQQISNQAESMKILPPTATKDIVGLNSRVAQLQRQFKSMEQNAIKNVGATQASAQVEQLRQRLSQTNEVQNQLNEALRRMDVSAANAAYNRLNSIVSETSRGIKENENAQHGFNNAVGKGKTEMNSLVGRITAVAAAYASIKTVGSVLNLSDNISGATARLNMMNDNMQTTKELQEGIYLAAQRSGGAYLDMMNTVSKIGLTAGNAFSSNNELIGFVEQLNKLYSISGASADDMRNSMVQLTQAMGSGVLRGDELNSIFEQAPTIIQTVAEYLDVPIEQIRDMAAEGKITSEIVKNSVLSMTEETNEAYKEMGTSFGQTMNNIQSEAIWAFQPVLERLNEIANGERFQAFVETITSTFTLLSGGALAAIDIIGSALNMIEEPLAAIGNWVQGIYESFVTNWAQIAPIVTMVASAIFGVVSAIALYNFVIGIATVAQSIFNAALWACPLTWIVVAVVAVIGAIYALVAGFNKAAGTSYSATGIIAGAFAVAGAFIGNLFLGLLDLILGFINRMVNPFIEVANFIGNVFENPVSSVIKLFQGMADNVIGIIQKIASAMDFMVGSNMAATVQGWRDSLSGMANKAIEKYAANENYQEVVEKINLSVEGLGLERFEYSKAWNAGYTAGESLEGAIEKFDPSSLFQTNVPLPSGNGLGALDMSAYGNGTFDTPGNDLKGVADGVRNIDANTSKSLDYSEEELKLWRDIAERDTVNRFTTAVVQVDFGGITNNVSSEMDLDGIVEYIGERTEERLLEVAEGVYV